MGYKDIAALANVNLVVKYYLNHVGYKASEIDFLADDFGTYYLNHVGYKVTSVGILSTSRGSII